MDKMTMRYYSEVSGAVMVKLALIAGGFYLGSWLDKRWNCFPLFTFTLVTIAGGLGIWWLVRVATKPRPN